MEEKKPVIKNKTRFAKAALSFLVAAGIALGGIFGFAGCKSNTTSSEPDRPPVVNPVEPETPVTPTDPVEPENPVTPEPEISITFEEFMDDHSEEALAFVNAYIKNDILDNKTPLSQTWGFHANDKDELDSVSLTYTYSTNATERAIEVANATFTNPIDLDNIVDGTVTVNQTENAITRQLAFEFDAKESYNNSNLASALCEMFGSEDAPKYFSEVESSESGERAFKVAEETSNAVNVYNIFVKGETNAEIISNLADSSKVESFQYATYPLGDKESITINTESYQVEEFAPENIQEAVNDFSAEIKQALDKNCLPTAGKNSFGNSFTTDKLVEYCWDIGNDDTISEVKLIATYNKYSDTTAYSVLKVKLKKSIDVKNLTEENIASLVSEAATNATYSQEYYFSYNPATQGTNDNLVNAIFEAYGMEKECPAGATRYIVDKGAAVDSTLASEVREYTVVQIENNKVSEVSIRIKTSSSENEYISKLSNSENYRITEEKSCTMDGQKISSDVETSVLSEDIEIIDEEEQEM